VSDERARRVYRELQRLARADYGGNTGALLVVYAVEGFLRRLAASTYATKLTLKGGMLMAAMSARRMTKDADLSAVGISNDESRVAAMVAEIASLRPDHDDALEFDVSTITTETMRDHAEYQSVRAKLSAHLATARITTTLDFSFGDPQRFTVTELPELLGKGTIRLASYLPEMTLAEKIATMMSRRELNTRDRDFADVWILSRLQTISAPSLRAAIVEVADYRNHDVVQLAEALADMPDRQVSYNAMLGRMAFQRVLPASWTELLADVRAFVDPLVADTTGSLETWDPGTQRWTS
jgi:hypothetical protein